MLQKGLKGIHSVYFIGIGGISMSALAKLLAREGYSVVGSDRVKNEETAELAAMGIRVFYEEDGQREPLVKADLVVYTDAIHEDCSQLQCAIAMKKRLLSRIELLSKICENFTQTIAIAGSHGKTTCTAMCAHVFNRLSTPFTAHIGGRDTKFGNFYSQGKEFLITEACEYRRNFLKIPAQRAVVLNVDYDHVECYRDIDDVTSCFKTFAMRAEVGFACADDSRCKTFNDCITFGVENPLSDYRAVELRAEGEHYQFYVEEFGKKVARIRLKAIGKCNVYNALAAFAVARSYSYPSAFIADGLEDFYAIKRRFETVGSIQGAKVICDYAHHPKEIENTLKTAKRLCKEKLHVVFQPHTYSRTKRLMQEFTNVLEGVESLMVYKTYAAREEYDEAGSAKRLAEKLGSLYCDDTRVLKAWLTTTVRDGDAVLFLGAGDIYHVALRLIDEQRVL